jgi:predicted nucleic acid-binding protein
MRRAEAAYWEWLLDSEIEVVEFTIGDIPMMRSWRKDYEDREVDLADASLVWLSHERHTPLIATTDFDDFETYRLINGKSFKLLIRRP